MTSAWIADVSTEERPADIIRAMEVDGAQLEVEVKLGVPSAEEARARLARLPATLEQDRRFEDNEIFDTPGGELGARAHLLRLRAVEGSGIVTWKEKVESPARAKVRREVQSRVGSPEAMRAIFLKLGLVRVYRYQKYRSDYGWTDASSGARLCISLDETPIGVFLELEGDKPAIDRAARAMGYGEEDYIVEDYRALHLAWLGQRGLPRADMVFSP